MLFRSPFGCGALTDLRIYGTAHIIQYSLFLRYFAFSASHLLYTASLGRFINRYSPTGNYGLIIAVLAVYALWVVVPFPGPP